MRVRWKIHAVRQDWGGWIVETSADRYIATEIGRKEADRPIHEPGTHCARRAMADR